jgi:hypothetical protein
MTLRQRQPRVECPTFLAFVRRRACCACGHAAPSQAAHIRFIDPRYPQKRAVGIGEKPSDCWCAPLCAGCHLDDPDAQHNAGEPVFWSRVGIDPFALAISLCAEFVAEGGSIKSAPRAPRKKTKFKSRKPTVKRAWPSKPFPPGRKFNRRSP